MTAPKKIITQGTIFSGVRSPYEIDSACHGICITARCDTAREFKAPSLTFLPVVRMDSWLWFEALPKSISDQKKTVIGNLKTHLVKKDGTSVVLDTFGPDRVFLSADPNDKAMNKQRELYDEALKAEQLRPFVWGEIPQSISKRIMAESNQLLTGKMQDFYFIDDVEGICGDAQNRQPLGFVALLRDIRTISRELALSIAEGVDPQQLNCLKKNDPTTHQLVLGEDGFSYPVGELISPFVEQLLQNFSILFGRIGTKNIPALYAERIQNLLGSSD